MEVIAAWIIFSLIVGAMSSSRTLGFAGGFLLSLLLSPLIGLIICLASRHKDTKKLIDHQLSQINNKESAASQIDKLKQQLDAGVITAEEFQVLKSKIITA